MRPATVRAGIAFVLSCALLACAPVRQPIGPPIGEAAIEDGALLTRDGVRLPLRRWLPAGDPAAVVLALHGFNDYSNAFEAPAQALAARGIATFAYDQRGFGAGPDPGLWFGGDALAGDAAAALGALRAAYPGRPLFLLGESMGGAVAALALARGDTPAIDGVILVAPAVWGWSSMSLAYRAGLWLMAHLAPSAHVSGRGLDITPSDNVPMLIALGADPLVIKETRVDAVYGLVDLMEAASRAQVPGDIPLLVQYGARDEIVPPEPVRRFVAGLPPGRRFVLYEQGYHMLLRDLEARIVYDDIMDWIDHGAPRASAGMDTVSDAFLAAGNEPTPSMPGPVRRDRPRS